MDYFYFYNNIIDTPGKNCLGKFLHLINGKYVQKGGIVGDFGCGNGYSAGRIRRKWKMAYVGMDISKYSIKNITKPEVLPVMANICQVPIKDRKFDFVVSCQVLEHLTEKDIFICLSEMYRTLKHNRYGFISVALKMDKYRAHITIKSSEWWKEIIESVGFCVKEIHMLQNFIVYKKKCV